MTEKRFRVTIGNENDVRFVDYVENRQLMVIFFRDYKEAVNCRDALLYQCNMMNELSEENIELKMKIQKVEEIIDNRLNNNFQPVCSDGKTELFIEEKLGYRFALNQLKKKLIRENIIKCD